MLDSETKRRIDTCRDILVGKVPDPKSQVEQITIALIYKFMDDMDAKSEELGGSRSFFTDEFDRYGWSKLMAPGLSGHEMLNIYAEAIQRMSEKTDIPALFREIFKNAFLPYRDPETLRSFLKEINTFTYDHSERLGDAFEYLLSVLGSQGDAGQFRTPRHIIDFMVEIIDPKKDETILDPACGTAGFLISAYKHIFKHNSREYRETYDEKGVLSLSIPPLARYSGDLLTPDDRRCLAANISGYDISPDMVRLSLVNMYLHGFTDPHIDEYDTLTSDEKWSESADIILANPPFMSPKGGIRPHNRFAVQSKRSEVLFVDYIAEHLTPNGRAAVVVPEGIIFQSQGAYKQLREMLVKDYLVAVISLPAGVFNPYSGVKTSILVMDKRLAKQRDEMLFVKIENDGFNLGAQRRPIDKNDLPDAVRAVKAFLQQGEVAEHKNVLAVSRECIRENGEWNLSIDRYVADELAISEYPLVKIGALFIDPKIGGTPPRKNEKYFGGGIPWVSIKDMENQRVIIRTKETLSQDGIENSNCKLIKAGSLLMSFKLTVGRISFAGMDLYTNEAIIAFEKNDKIDLDYLSYMLPAAVDQDTSTNVFNAKSLNKAKIKEMVVPLPPLEMQKEIVAEIEGYQKIIDGARQVVESYQPHISINGASQTAYNMISLGDNAIFKIESGGTPKSTEESYWNGGVNWATLVDLPAGDFVSQITDTERTISEKGLANSSAKILPVGTVIVSTRATIGRVGIAKISLATNQGFKNIIIKDETMAIPEYVAYMMKNLAPEMETIATGGTFKEISKSMLSTLVIPLPPLDVQRGIVAEIEECQILVNANKELIHRFEEKIKQTINRVWGNTE